MLPTERRNVQDEVMLGAGWLLVLLRHDDSRYGCFGRIVWQHGQRMRVRASTTVICHRMVAIEFSICRSGRVGGASGSRTRG